MTEQARPPCAWKRRYRHSRPADAALSKMRARGIDAVTLNVYHCPWCGYYHIGNSKRLAKLAKQQRESALDD